jgi:uncharacterized spore protein YtfJ
MMADTALADVVDKLSGIKDVMTVKRVFGDPTQVDGITVLPVAVVRGGGGAGGGGGSMPEQEQQGEGAGMGFGLNARGIGVFAVQDGSVTWQPAVDVTRIIVGAQLVAVAALFVLGGVLRRRRR